MKRETVIRLKCDLRDDGSVHVHSPDLPLFHVTGDDAEEAQALTLGILKEYLERNYHIAVEIRFAESLEDFLARRDEIPAVPAHVIAELAA